MAMYNIEENVLCACSAYEQKYYLNERFEGLPTQIKDELKIMNVLFTEDVGGVIKFYFDEDGTLLIGTEAAEEDILYDEIGAGLKIRSLQREKQEFLEALEMYYRVKFLNESLDDKE